MTGLGDFREWNRVHGRLHFYTEQTKNRIPAADGCYAWFLPLWLYTEDLDQLLGLLNKVLRYEPSPEQDVAARFNWDHVELKVRRNPQVVLTDKKRAAWRTVLADAVGRNALQRTLLEASLLMPPLYVGRTKNLQKRYTQHVEGNDREENNFHRRFRECVHGAGLRLSVSDLLFVCIRTSPELTALFAEDEEVGKLIEQVLMQTCRPPFSLK